MKIHPKPDNICSYFEISRFFPGQVRLVAVRELQSATGEELSALLPSVLDRTFKGEI